ncbi:MAG: TIM barrel protein [Gammaproteobacteria bacterium]|nr:TIM barrel protein [Gammaproteobacteria bacterium]
MKPISVQLYALREQSQTDFDKVLNDIANIGYRGVEPFHLFGKSPEAFKRQVEDLGMQISSSHHPWANRTEINEAIETVQALGLNRIAAGYGPDDVKDADSVKRTVDAINSLTESLAPHGLRLFLHNHYWEFVPVDGELPYHSFYKNCPDVEFEVDTYWAANFGACDPAQEVANVKDRAPLLHIKDGPNEQGKAHVAVGDGVLEIADIINAADPAVLEWVIVELDACDSDMLEAIRRSYEFLTTERLALGRS